MIFACGRGQRTDLPSCICGDARKIDVACTFELRGAAAGKICGKPLCKHCAVRIDDQPLCPAHSRLITKEGTTR
jgi:hypothetical protein